MPGLPDEVGMRYSMGAKMKSAGDRVKLFIESNERFFYIE
jgi:hypothetical protein